MSSLFKRLLIELRPSPIDGVGVFAVVELRRDQRIADGVHESDFRRLVRWGEIDQLDQALREKISAFCLGTPEGFVPPDELDFNKLSVEWYLNHSCDGNLGFDEKGDFVARREIKRGEELTYDYGLAESNPAFRMECKCASAACRKIITGNDWREVSFREKNLDYMLPRLRRTHALEGAAPSEAHRLTSRRR
jgi:SET domain-containing protein